MVQRPSILVTFVHMDGPLKSQIQELREDEISIGRHSSCEVQFPKDLLMVSRIHARIIREGNRFKLMDESSNGTFVNGKPVKEIFLESGDVLDFAPGGPKMSFLTTIEDAPRMPERVKKALNNIPHADELSAEVTLPPPQQPSPEPQHNTGSAPSIQKVRVPLVIQFGPTLKSYKELPITVGKNPSCEFSIEHSEIMDRHAQFFFDQNQYWVKDLTGKGLVSINNSPINTQAPLEPDSLLSLCPNGPAFRFLGGGRLAEYET